jgi:hypothetical protein
VHVDANCAGLAILTPQNLTFLSGFDTCDRYRLAIDGVANTNRDIYVGDIDKVDRQLHNHMLKKFFGNLGKPLFKYDAQTIDARRVDDNATHAFYPLVTPYVPRSQIVQLQLFSNTNMAQKTVFYVSNHQRVLKISNGRVMLM